MASYPNKVYDERAPFFSSPPFSLFIRAPQAGHDARGPQQALVVFPDCTVQFERFFGFTKYAVGSFPFPPPPPFPRARRKSSEANWVFFFPFFPSLVLCRHELRQGVSRASTYSPCFFPSSSPSLSALRCHPFYRFLLGTTRRSSLFPFPLSG